MTYYQSSPVAVLRGLEQIGDPVHARGRGEEDGPPLTVGQRGAQPVHPRLLAGEGGLVEDDSVEAHTTERVGVLGRLDGDAPAVT